MMGCLKYELNILNTLVNTISNVFKLYSAIPLSALKILTCLCYKWYLRLQSLVTRKFENQ